MAEQQRIPGPFGDIFLVNTPTLDNVAKQLYVQQQQRQVLQQRENQALDQAMQKEYANIRSVDTPEVVNTYNQLKGAKKNILFNKELQRDPLLYNQAQQQTNEIQARLNKLINRSKEVKEMTKMMTQDRFKNPDAYADDFGQRASVLMNTPLGALNQHPDFGDLTNWDQYRYQGANTDFNSKLIKAAGQPRKIVGKEEPLDKVGLQFRAPVYEYGNTPAQVFEGLVQSLDHKTERDAAYKWKQLTPEVIQDIEKQYSAIPKQKWEQMGLPGAQDINLRAGSDAEKYMRIMAMQNAVNTQPRLVNYENRTSEKAKADLAFARDKEMQRIRHMDARDLIDYKKKIDPNDAELNNTWVDTYWQNLIDKARSDKKKKMVVYTPNTSMQAYEISADPILMKAFTRGAGKNATEPDKMFVTEEGKIMPVFYKYKEDPQTKVVSVVKNEKGDPVVDTDYSQAMDIDQAKLALGYKGQTKKQLAETMSGGGKKAASKQYSVDGKTYTHAQLNAMGYDDNEIDQAIKAGIIK